MILEICCFTVIRVTKMVPECVVISHYYSYTKHMSEVKFTGKKAIRYTCLREEWRQRHMGIQNEVLLKTLTFQPKTILEQFSKTSEHWE